MLAGAFASLLSCDRERLTNIDFPLALLIVERCGIAVGRSVEHFAPRAIVVVVGVFAVVAVSEIVAMITSPVVVAVNVVAFALAGIVGNVVGVVVPVVSVVQAAGACSGRRAAARPVFYAVSVVLVVPSCKPSARAA